MRKSLELRTGMAVDAATPHPILLIDPGVVPIGGGHTRSIRVGAENRWSDKFGDRLSRGGSRVRLTTSGRARAATLARSI